MLLVVSGVILHQMSNKYNKHNKLINNKFNKHNKSINNNN